MARPGTEYQELVALVAKALDPAAKIKIGQWVEGPDGGREVDVEVRGTACGKPHFVLIECKDWKRSVDIQEVDKLDSKRRDLAADAAMIYSNSGFTRKALRKAERLGIDVVSADSWSLGLYPTQASANCVPSIWDARTLRHDGRPVVNWLHTLSLDLLRQHEGEPTVIHSAAFKTETSFVLEGMKVALLGLRVTMSCSRTWLSQRVRDDVSLGVYNHITRRLSIPSNQYWSFGWVDPKAWLEIRTDSEPEEWTKPLDPGSFQLNLTLLNPIARIEGEEEPPIEGLIAERKTEMPR